MTPREVGVLLLLGTASACGLSVSGSGSTPTRVEISQTSQTSEGVGPSASGSGPLSSVSEGGAPAEGDGGADPDGGNPGSLACTSSSQCSGNRSCCFGQAVGAYCGKDCLSTESVLCRIGMADCGGDEFHCVALPSVLPSDVGRCINVEGG